MGNKNIFIAAVLIIGFMIFWERFVLSRYAPPKPPETTTQAAPSGQTMTSDAGTGKGTPSPVTNVTPIKTDDVEKYVVLETESTRLVFGTKGARVASWQLREKDHWVELVTNPLVDRNNQPVDVGDDEDKAERLTRKHPLETFPNLNFSVQSHTDNSISFAADHPDGFRISKQFRLSDEPHLSSVELQFTNLRDNTVRVQTEFGWDEGLGKQLVAEDGQELETPPVEHEMRVVGWADKVFKWRKGFIFGRTIDKTVTHNFSWIGTDNSHFLAAFLPSDFSIKTARVLNDKKTYPSVRFPVSLALDPGQTKEVDVNLFVGPKVMTDLKAMGNNLDKSIDFGFFGIIALAIFKILTFLTNVTGNYGWAIVITTILYQILVLPLTKKSLEHSIKMREVQPQIKKIQQQFKKDPKRLQIETLNIYKKHGMKFMGMEGCLPMLVQIPFFFAVYSTLQVAFELRGAPWVLWIHDLSLPDPLYILPVLMGAGTFLQQKLTNVSVDPAQAKMMMFMPVFLVFIFLRMPSGLVLYWCTQSFATIIIQRFLQISKNNTPKPTPA